MRKLCAIAVALTGVASVSVATASAPVVPPSVLNAIKRRVNPLYAYSPGYVPVGVRYWKWESSARWLTIRFRKSGTSLEAVSFTAGPYAPLERRCNGAHAGRTFHISGGTVYWAATYEDQEAWRCVRTQNGRVIALSAAQSVSGHGSSNPASHWALDLARVVASGHRIK